MKEIIYVLFIITTISSNKVFSQEENSIYYITDLRGDISLEMEINNLQSNNGPLYIRILDENENPVIVGKSPVINYSARISFDSILQENTQFNFFMMRMKIKRWILV